MMFNPLRFFCRIANQHIIPFDNNIEINLLTDDIWL